MAYSFGLGPSDWLKMSGATTKPLTTSADPKKAASTVAPIASTTPAYTDPKKAGAPTIPLGTPTPYTDPKQAASPFAVTDPSFNIAPPKAVAPVAAPTAMPVTSPQVDPTSGLPIQPAGTKPTTVTSAVPIPAGTDQTQPQTVAYKPEATPVMTEATPAPAAQTYTPPASETTVQPEQPTTAAPPVDQPNPVTAPPEAPVTAPVKTEPSLDDNLANFEKIAADWANGVVDDKVFRTTANRAILQMGLNNQAETDALQMRINSDPALKGQGAGSALLSMMAANHGFSADQMFGQLAQSAQEKILDMQKYGLQEGVAINQMRRQNDYAKLQMLQDAGDFSGAAQLAAKIADFPGANISPSSFSAARTRLAEDAKSLIASGNYTSAAEKLSQMTGQTVDATQLQSRDPALWTQAQALEDKGDFAGASKIYANLGLSISPDDLRAQNPFQQQTWAKTLDAIKATAMTNPALATAQLDALMKNPAAAKYLGFTPDTSAAELINSIVTGKYQADQDMRTGLQAEINLKAKSGVGFSQALVDYKAQGPLAWQGMTQDGKKMAGSSLDSFNSARTALGMSAVHKDSQGNIVDANGVALTDEDFAQTAAAADYTSRIDKMKTQPWQAAFDNLMAPGSPMHDKILSIPGGEAAVKESLQMLFLGGGYKTDPSTGQLVPDYSGGMPWENSSPTSYLFHNWPLAQFNTDGTVNGKYDVGGETYGDKLGDTVIQKLPDDEDLDHSYATYKYNGGALSSSQWYFATAGGTKAPDTTKIPSDVKPAEDATPTEPPSPIPTTTVDPTTGITTTTTNDPVTGKPVTNKTAPDNISTAFAALDGQAGLNAYLASHPNGAYVTVSQDGKTVAKVTGVLRDSGNSKNGNVIELQAPNGQKVYYDPEFAEYMAITDVPTKVGSMWSSGTENIPRLNGGKTYKTFAEALEHANPSDK